MPEEQVDVAPSDDQGNVPLDAPSLPATPTPEVKEATPEEPAKPAEPAAPTLYELPDGRKVTAEELYKEHTENLLPEFTRRSQELAKLKESPPPADLNNSQPEKNRYADPTYIPQSYEEIIAAAEARALAKVEDRERQAIELRQSVETQVANDIAELKKSDPALNPDALFNHAVKYNFTDLKLAYQNMKDMAAAVKTAQTETVKNITKRTDPIATKPGGTGAKPNPAHFGSARDYLKAVTGSQ